jgi:hypothetical protein
MTTVAVLHPGEMGASIGAALRACGHRVVWASEGRSAASSARADAAGLEDVSTVARVASESSVILSICPPAFAVDVASLVAATGFAGMFIDANAIAPATAARVAASVGTAFVDGDLIGGPARPRLYLSGTGAPDVAALFDGSVVDAVVLPGEFSASALKSCYAAWTKGTQALLLAIRAVARASGVEDALLEEWQPDLVARSEAAAGSARKAWRFGGEMREIALAFSSAGAPDGFAIAAASVFDHLSVFKDVDASLDDVLALLAHGS